PDRDGGEQDQAQGQAGRGHRANGRVRGKAAGSSLRTGIMVQPRPTLPASPLQASARSPRRRGTMHAGREGPRMRRWLAVLSLLVLGSAAAALPPAPPQFMRIGVAEGLPSSVSYKVVQDHDGFLWFGTQDGLARYD